FPNPQLFGAEQHRRNALRLPPNSDAVSVNTDPSQFSGKIIECHGTQRRKYGVLYRSGLTKVPQMSSTYRKVMMSITDNITEIICLPMYADKIKADNMVSH
ncbi:hypothetical protein Leryth_011125, partial [Lithospermum erythrorhizon]